MNYLYNIDGAKSLYEGVTRLNRNFHILDILISNIYTNKWKWNMAYDYSQGNTTYNQRFQDAETFIARYKAYKNAMRLRDTLLSVPVAIFYPTPITTFSETDDLETIQNWMNETFLPGDSGFNEKRVYAVHVISNDTNNKNKEIFKLFFKWKDNQWEKTTENYLIRTC